MSAVIQSSWLPLPDPQPQTAQPRAPTTIATTSNSGVNTGNSQLRVAFSRQATCCDDFGMVCCLSSLSCGNELESLCIAILVA